MVHVEYGSAWVVRRGYVSTLLPNIALDDQAEYRDEETCRIVAGDVVVVLDYIPTANNEFHVVLWAGKKWLVPARAFGWVFKDLYE